MAVTTLERPAPRERPGTVRGFAPSGPVWVEPVRPHSRLVPAVQPLAAVLPLHDIPQTALEHPMRLTRRGRLTMTLVSMACVVAISGMAYSSSSDAATPARPSDSMVVAPSESIWEIAQRADPQADPRVAVARIIELNRLSSGQIRPGQRLLLPAD